MSGVSLCRLRCTFISVVLTLGVSTPLLAQSLRDPTLAPATVAPSSSGNANPSTTIQPGAVTVMVRGGVPYLVVGTRLYARGQKLGQARIERISETQVWLREDGALRKVPVFDGIERRATTPAGAVKKPLRAVRKTVQPKP